MYYNWPPPGPPRLTKYGNLSVLFLLLLLGWRPRLLEDGEAEKSGRRERTIQRETAKERWKMHWQMQSLIGGAKLSKEPKMKTPLPWWDP